MPSPVIRIAPKPSRLTGRSPPNFQVELVTGLFAVDESAPRIVADPPAKSVAPVPRLMPRNVRRVMPLSTRFCFAFGDSSDITTRYVYGNRYQRQRNSDWRSRNIKCLDAPRFSYLNINYHRDDPGYLFTATAL